MTDIVQAAETLADETQAEKDRVIAEAKERQAAAEATARQVTDAAMQTELARSLNARVDQCSMDLSTFRTEVMTRLETQAAKITELEARPVAVVTPPPVVSTSIPEPSGEVIPAEVLPPPPVAIVPGNVAVPGNPIPEGPPRGGAIQRRSRSVI